MPATSACMPCLWSEWELPTCLPEDLPDDVVLNCLLKAACGPVFSGSQLSLEYQ